ncbi:MAG: FliM/FliN family flagellar motor switch protein, partial [Pseudomonadota bacterium]
DEEDAVDEAWQAALFDKIENLKISLQVEIGSAELSLSQMDRLKTGSSLELEINPNRMMISTDHGQCLLIGSIQTTASGLEIQVHETFQKGE